MSYRWTAFLIGTGSRKASLHRRYEHIEPFYPENMGLYPLWQHRETFSDPWTGFLKGFTPDGPSGLPSSQRWSHYASGEQSLRDLLPRNKRKVLTFQPYMESFCVWWAGSERPFTPKRAKGASFRPLIILSAKDIYTTRLNDKISNHQNPAGAKSPSLQTCMGKLRV